MMGHPPRVVWHTTESDTGDRAFNGVVGWLRYKGSEPHLVWDPTTGRVGQFLPANVSGRALANAGLHRTNRAGVVTIQIEVMGRAANNPLKHGPWNGFDTILRWLDSWGIPRTWPAGLPPRSVGSYGVDNGYRSMGLWLEKGGHYGHVQVPGNTHSDPGEIDPARWSDRGTRPDRGERPKRPKVKLARVQKAARTDPDAPAGTFTARRQVRRVERALRREGLLDRRYVDGHYGTATVAAYAAWQRKLGYSGADADGIPGAASLKALGRKHGFRVIV